MFTCTNIVEYILISELSCRVNSSDWYAYTIPYYIHQTQRKRKKR